MDTHIQPNENNINLNDVDTCSILDNNEYEIKEKGSNLQKTSNSCSLMHNSRPTPFQLARVSENLNDSITTTQSHGTQKAFGSQMKYQVRYVNLPAKFLFGTGYKNVAGGTPVISNPFNVAKTNPNSLLLKNNLPCKIGDSIDDTLILNPSVMSQKKGCAQNNPSTITESHLTKGNENSALSKPPPMLIINNQVVKLKGIKHQEMPLGEKYENNSKSGIKNKCNTPIYKKNKLIDQCCQTETTLKSVDQSTQTYIYSWLYKNSKLYTFIDDGGKQVKIVPVTTEIMSRRSNETGVASPLSSIDNDSDSCLEDEISVTDKPVVTKRTYDQSSTTASIHTDNSVSCHNKFKIKSNISLPTSYNLQPKNIFQEVLFTNLGLNNSVSMSTDDSKNISANKNRQDSRCEQLHTEINTVYNHELQMYVPTGSVQSPESEFHMDHATVSPDVRQSKSNTEPIVTFFNKLIEDIKTCLSTDMLGNIPLHQAAMERNLDRLKSQCVVLKTIGSNLNHINLAHETALMLAVKVAVDTKDYEAVSILVSEGADQCITDENGDTPLHYVVRYGCGQLVKVLLTADDADKVTEKFNHDGLTPLHIAAMEGHDEIIRLLVGTTININVKDRKNGRTPYFMAVKEKKWSSATLLKIFGANISEPNFADQIPHHINSEKSGDSPLQKTHAEIGVSVPDDLDQTDILINRKITGAANLSNDFKTNDQALLNFENIDMDSHSPVIDEENIGNHQKKDESHNEKELCHKYEQNMAKRKADFQISLPEDLKTKKVKLKPPAQNKVIKENLKSKNIAVSSLSRSKERYICNGSKDELSQSSSLAQKEISSEFSKNKTLKISINNESVLHNKAILTSANVQTHHLNKDMIGQMFGNENPSESTLIGDIDRLSSKTVQGTIIQNDGGTSEILEPFTKEQDEEIISNRNKNNSDPECVSDISIYENLERGVQESTYSNSEENTSINSSSHPEHNSSVSVIDKTISNEKEPSNVNCSSLPYTSNYSQNIFSEAENNLSGKSKQPRDSNLSIESQEINKSSSTSSEHNIEQTCHTNYSSNNSQEFTSEHDGISKITPHQEKIVVAINTIHNLKNSKMILLPDKNSPNTGPPENTNFEKAVPSDNSKLEASVKPLSNIKPKQSSSSELVTIMRNKLISLVSCKASLKPPNGKTSRALPHLSDPVNNTSKQVLDKSETKISTPHIPSDSKTTFSETTTKLNKSPNPTLLNDRTQASKTTSRKRSSDSEQEIEKKRIDKNNSVDLTQGESCPTFQKNTWRRSARIPKKKVGFDL